MSVLLVLMFLLTSTMNVNASLSISQSDDTGYSAARVVGSPPICFYDKDWDSTYGWVEVKGDHNIPWGLEYCQMEVVMRFKAPDDYTSFRVASEWCLTYMVETNWPVGYASVQVKYVLYSDGYSALETRSSGFSISASTPLWGGYDSEDGIASRDAESYVLFYYDLQDGTWYRMAVQLYIALDGEGNAWSQSGVGNPVNLDVGLIWVYN